MLYLIFTICSIVHGASCHEERIPLEEGTSMMACAMAGQFEGAKYSLTHHNSYITRYQCKPASQLYTNL